MRKVLTRNTALKIALIFFVFSIIWIFLTDNLVLWLYQDPSAITNYQMFKGSLFVLITTILIYFLISKEIKAKNKMIAFLNKSEHWYNLMLSNIPGVDVLIFDTNARVILAQGKELARHGIDVSMIQNRHMDDVPVSQPTYDFFMPKLNDVLSGKKVEAKYTFKQDTYQVKGLALKDEADRVFAGLIVIINVTSQHNLTNRLKNQKEEYEKLSQKYYNKNQELLSANRELKKAKEKAEESDKLKSSFLANMSHEIRTPLNGIMGFSQLIANNKINKDELKSYAGYLVQNSEQLLNVIEDVLLMSSLETGQYHFNYSECKISNVFDEIITIANKKMSEAKKKITLRTDFDRGLNDQVIDLDKQAFLKACEKIIDNAVKYAPGNSGIDIKLYQQDSDMLCLMVNDEGPGIPKEKQHLVFERFYQLNATLSRPDTGNGLGLPIAKALINGLSGEIQINSEEGRGAEFSVLIPVTISHSVSDKTDSKRDLQRKSSGNKILIVEDMKDNCILLEAYLRKYDVQVLHAINADEARQIIKKHPDIDLIMMDIRLPDGSGIDLAREFREENIDIPIIAQTAYADSQDELFVRQAGCDDYLAKPILKQDFLHKVS
ncbi:MAG: hybrid sensor histidine kinase/response regulator, partial [Bacteroidota bacterium]